MADSVEFMTPARLDEIEKNTTDTSRHSQELIREIRRLWEANTLIHNARAFHRCEGGRIRPYPTVACSCCRQKEQSQDFDAVRALEELIKFVSPFRV